MSYTIRNADGTILLSLADNTVDKTTTSLSLVGRNVSSYGQYYNNNLIQMLANSANTTNNPPRNPLKGQLWYDSTVKKLKIYDSGFKPISGAIISGSQPIDLFSGDLWFDSTNNQLKIYSGNIVYTVGPAFPGSIGDTGWTLPLSTLKDSASRSRQVVLLKSYGQFVGMMSRSSFELSNADSLTYFNTSTTATVVSGLTVLGDIKFTGQGTNKNLSMNVDIDKLGVGGNVTSSADYNNQNQKIISLLARMFPITANTATNDIGVQLGSEARVLCYYSNPSSSIEIRRFYVVNQPGIGISWQPYNIYTGTAFPNKVPGSF